MVCSGPPDETRPFKLGCGFSLVDAPRRAAHPEGPMHGCPSYRAGDLSFIPLCRRPPPGAAVSPRSCHPQCGSIPQLRKVASTGS